MTINHIITSSLVIVFVFLIGAIFENKISACLKYSLWLLVVIKLLVPIPEVESGIHVMNYMGTFIEVTKDRIEMLAGDETDWLLDESLVTEDKNSEQLNHIVSHDFDKKIHTDINRNPKQEAVIADKVVEKLNRTTTVFAIIKVVYFVGVFGILSIIIISNLRFNQGFKKKRKYINTYNNKIPVYKIEGYYGACLYGGFSPVIIVGNNTNLSMEQHQMILLHEYVHYAHGDHIWSMLRNLCVALYWYNPLVWLAASVSRKDSELACDEGTIKRLGKAKRITYGQMLLEVVAKASPQKDITSVVFLNSTTAARGKKEMKKRIEVIAKRKKTSKIAVLLTMVLSVACIGCTFGEPVGETSEELSAVNENIEVDEKVSNKNTLEADEIISKNKLSEQIPNAFEEEIVLEKNKYVWPTKSKMISNGFGERIHPITGEKKSVDYISIAGNQGDSVYAVADGDIIDVGFDNTLGNYIVLATIAGEEVTYGHLEGSKVAMGAQVEAGDIIGFMGKTGSATGTFLSVAVKVDGEAVDPMPYFETDFLDETITYNGKEYKKSELCNATLKWLELSEQDRMLSSYFPPEFMIFEETWGITLTAENVTPTGVTIRCTQSSGAPTGELQTGSWYILETWTREYGWKQIPYIIDGEIGWTSEAWMIPMNDTCDWEVEWEWLYGALPSGKYRIGKSVMDFRGTGNFDTAVYYAEFEIKK